jgi:hypothetical protein
MLKTLVTLGLVAAAVVVVVVAGALRRARNETPRD